MATDRGYERPLVEPDNLMTGGFQSGRFDASPRTSTGRSSAVWALVFAVLWIFGVGSLVAIGMAVLALSSGDIGAKHRRMAQAAILLSGLGLFASALIFVSG